MALATRALTSGQTLAKAPQKLALSKGLHPVQLRLIFPWIHSSTLRQLELKACSFHQRRNISKHPLALREAVANLYNVTYREGKASQYTYENVCIVPGGRAGLSRIAAVVGDVYTVCSSTSSHLSPDPKIELSSPRLYGLRSNPECLQTSCARPHLVRLFC